MKLMAIEFMDAVIVYLNHHVECVFHQHSDMAPELLELFALVPNTLPQWDQLCQRMKEPLSQCIDCVTVYQESKLVFIQRYHSVYGTEALNRLMLKLLEWDTSRHLSDLTR
jgi:hypothetical protein